MLVALHHKKQEVNPERNEIPCLNSKGSSSSLITQGREFSSKGRKKAEWNGTYQRIYGWEILGSWSKKMKRDLRLIVSFVRTDWGERTWLTGEVTLERALKRSG